VYFECVWLLYRRFFDCFSVICNKTFYKVYTLFSHTHLTTLSQLLAVGGVTQTYNCTRYSRLRESHFWGTQFWNLVTLTPMRSDRLQRRRLFVYVLSALNVRRISPVQLLSGMLLTGVLVYWNTSTVTSSQRQRYAMQSHSVLFCRLLLAPTWVFDSLRRLVSAFRVCLSLSLSLAI